MNVSIKPQGVKSFKGCILPYLAGFFYDASQGPGTIVIQMRYTIKQDFASLDYILGRQVQEILISDLILLGAGQTRKMILGSTKVPWLKSAVCST